LVLGKSPEIYPEDSSYNPSYDGKKYTAFDGDYFHEDVPGSEVSPQSNVRPTSHPTPRFLLNAALAGRGPPRQATLGELSAELDQFGPEEFSKRVTQYGTWLGSHPHGLGASTATARRTYDFLQDRLSFWLGYQPVSPEAHANLLSASSILYQGGQTAQIVGVDEMSPSTQQAAVASMAFEGPNLRLGGKSAPTRESIEGFPEFYAGSLGKFKGLGGFLDRNEVGITWGRGIRNQGLKDQGGPWEDFLEKQMPPRSRLHQFSKTWDLKGETSGTAISAKTLDTSSYWYAKNPANVYYTLARYIREAAEYDNGPKPKKINIDRSEISARQIQLAVPLYTSQAQWQQIKRAIKYGRDRGISVIVSKVR
jgi:hypothetical protein